MKSFAILAMAGAAVAYPQGVTEDIAPKESIPAGCTIDYPKPFQISIVNVTSPVGKRDLSKRQSKPLIVTLKNSVLTDDLGRTGYIADNNQFQFDGPAQTGAIYTAGWSVCQNGTLALGNSAIFYQCLSGNFYNLYDDAENEQCSPVYIDVVDSDTQGSVSQIADGQVTGKAVATQISDGQVQQPTSVPAVVSQISDGQIQVPTKVAVVSQISDGQIQVPTKAAVVSQISDGQIQAPTSAPAPAPSSRAVVTQIGDGQIQAPTSAPAPAPSRAVVTQIGDGQIQFPQNGTTMATPSVAVFTGSASSIRSGFFGLAAAAIVACLL